MIDNITWDPDRITTTVAGTTFTHTPGCALHRGQPDINDDWMHGCSCFISRVRVTNFPDGTEVPVKGPRTQEGKTYPQWKQLIAERNEGIRQARFWRKCTAWLGGAMAFSVAADIGHALGWY